MGVYIKGMEMPTNDDMAPTAVWVYPNGYVIVFKDNGNMRQYTEAIPVPAHGRLIDADALVSDLIFPTEQFKRGFCALMDDAPTVIPAEEGK